MSKLKGNKKAKVDPPIYVEQDKKIVQLVVKCGPPYRLREKKFWENVAGKLKNEKVLDIEADKLKTRWVVLLDSKLEAYLGISGIGDKESFGFDVRKSFEENLLAFEARLMTAHRIQAANAAIANSAVVQPQTERYRIQVHYKLPLVFTGSTEGDASRDVHGFQIPPQLFNGFEFFIVDPAPGLIGAVERTGLEHLIKYHGGHLITDWEKIRDYGETEKNNVVSLAMTDIPKNKAFIKTLGCKVYRPKLVYDCINENKFMTPELLIDFVWVSD